MGDLRKWVIVTGWDVGEGWAKDGRVDGRGEGAEGLHVCVHIKNPHGVHGVPTDSPGVGGARRAGAGALAAGGAHPGAQPAAGGGAEGGVG